ncbi:uncharacterized protein [Channa argus]|uniref:uncharacterized protein isoform X1 n=1 Tax=Channa argus TaxID=215402 RepID=UPI003521370A
MADFLFLVQLLMVMKLAVLNKTSSAEIILISVNSSEIVLLPSGLRVEEMEHRWDDIRWIHRPLEKNGSSFEHRRGELARGMTKQSWDARVVSLKRNLTTCDHRRCELLRDGSLRFSKVQTEDSGIYSLEVFYKNGTIRMKKDFQLRVEGLIIAESQRTENETDYMPGLICCLLLLPMLFFIVFFTLRRRRRNRKKKISGPTEENVYLSMHGPHGNMRKDENKAKQEIPEEPTYVLFNPTVSMETVDVGGERNIHV